MEESYRKEKRVLWELKLPEEYLRMRRREVMIRKRRAGDRISQLPDSLISQILLLHLPKKDVVKTSVLSKRWKTLWLQSPWLENLDADEFPDYNAFVSFVNSFLDFSSDSCLQKLKLSIRRNEEDQSRLTQWIDSVVKRKIKHLDVECHVMRQCMEVIPKSLYICETLVHLRFHRVSMVDFESVSLPCVRIMRLEHNVYVNDAPIELLISSCPVLEDLSIARRVDDNIKVLRVYSQTLTTLNVEFYAFEDGYEDEADDVEFDHKGSGVHIDCPRLTYLNFEDDMSKSKIISNTGSLTKVNIVGAFNLIDCFDNISSQRQNMIREFFASFSSVKDMLISWHTLEYLYHNSKIEPLQQFHNVSRLEVTFSLSYLKLLPRLLESFPNLKSLVIELEFCIAKGRKKKVTLSSVPPCLVSSLEFVEIKGSFCGIPAEMELVRYLVENSVILKKLVLHLSCIMLEQGCRVFMDLLALPRRSSTCQIIFS